ncbi:TerB family tellurite resistance protein [Gammaproteobacteria bacterium]|nr:TerB family tellurite resistance protein [Gammaproteobacteria bacterium]MDA8926507.1 TerB family tellurite resistance protein [Gammaproteobacteria bacterium]MDB4156505.1 TerB family tellurite resistance protein [Gammaproteobacteria bacterium]
MFNIFKKNKNEEINIDKHNFEIDLIACVLAYEVARADGNISDNELNSLLKEIEKITADVNKNPDEIFSLIENYSENSVSFHEFISDINNDFNKKDKLELIQYLWDVAYADNVLDVNEERLIRRIANLINLKDLDVLKLKDKAKN